MLVAGQGRSAPRLGQGGGGWCPLEPHPLPRKNNWKSTDNDRNDASWVLSTCTMRRHKWWHYLTAKSMDDGLHACTTGHVATSGRTIVSTIIPSLAPNHKKHLIFKKSQKMQPPNPTIPKVVEAK